MLDSRGPGSERGHGDHELLPLEMLVVAWKRRAGRTFEERRKLRPESCRHRGPCLERCRSAVAALDTTEERLRQARPIRDIGLAKAGAESRRPRRDAHPLRQ